MFWHRVEPVQTVAALILTGDRATQRLTEAIAGRSPAIRTLPVVLGEGWAAIFARPLPGESDAVLPRLEGVTALYRAGEDWWFPVGCALAVPAHAFSDVLACFAVDARLPLPAIVIPRFDGGDRATTVDAYPVPHAALLTLDAPS